MKISALNISLSAFAFGLVFTAHFDPATLASENSPGGKKHEPGREVIERLGPHGDVDQELEQLERQVGSKDILTIDEYQDIQSQLDELLQRVNEQAKASGKADAELFGEVLELQESVNGIDVR
ncbi:hypothetical protein [Planococcus maitriensis]|uniref:Uncharacterized protein n=1 Tax=Planococcus maitriensis TaxID=221799 RepID=A0A365KAB7_9BACL|nr:hypothetical protein [Planococcus maitriensis]RAZ69730.1 hypothetical protein DP119_03470 [Planococcus maitriensis]